MCRPNEHRRYYRGTINDETNNTSLFSISSINLINTKLTINETRHQRPLNFLIDTGASVSIIKGELLHPKLVVHRDKILKIIGITVFSTL